MKKIDPLSTPYTEVLISLYCSMRFAQMPTDGLFPPLGVSLLNQGAPFSLCYMVSIRVSVGTLLELEPEPFSSLNPYSWGEERISGQVILAAWS